MGLNHDALTVNCTNVWKTIWYCCMWSCLLYEEVILAIEPGENVVYSQRHVWDCRGSSLPNSEYIEVNQQFQSLDRREWGGKEKGVIVMEYNVIGCYKIMQWISLSDIVWYERILEIQI